MLSPTWLSPSVPWPFLPGLSLNGPVFTSLSANFHVVLVSKWLPLICTLINISIAPAHHEGTAFHICSHQALSQGRVSGILFPSWTQDCGFPGMWLTHVPPAAVQFPGPILYLHYLSRNLPTWDRGQVDKAALHLSGSLQ